MKLTRHLSILFQPSRVGFQLISLKYFNSKRLTPHLNMKKLLLSVAILCVALISCGPNAEEKKAAQKENEEMVDEKVSEIMESLNESAEEASPAADSAISDTTAAHDHSEEGHSH